MRIPALVCSILLFGACLLGARSAESSAQMSREGAIVIDFDAIVEPYVELGMFSGVVLVARDGRVVSERAYGLAAAAHGVPNTPATRFRVASISKPLTAMTVAALWRDGFLTPDTTLDAVLPEFPRAGEITIEHLLGHRSGVVHINDLPWYEDAMRREVPLAELIERIALEPLRFEPGSAYEYSNGGYALLAAVIERLTRAAYGDAIRRLVFDPLGMRDSAHEVAGVVIPDLAEGYQPGLRAGEVAPGAFVAPSIKIGGGSVYSTARDLLRFDRALRDAALVDAWMLDRVFGDRTGASFTGRAPGYTAVLSRSADPDITIIVLANTYSTATNSIAARILDALSGEAAAPAYQPAPTGAEIDDFAGRFRWPAPFDNPFDLLPAEDGWVYAEPESGVRTFALPLVGDAVLLPMYDAVVRLDDNGDLRCTAPWLPVTLTIERR